MVFAACGSIWPVNEEFGREQVAGQASEALVRLKIPLGIQRITRSETVLFLHRVVCTVDYHLKYNFRPVLAA